MKLVMKKIRLFRWPVFSHVYGILFMAMALFYVPPSWGQAIPIPSSWDINVNGYIGILDLESFDPVTHEVKGKILGRDIQGHVVDRHLQMYRHGTYQMYDLWLLDPELGAHGQAYYDGRLFMTGTVSEAKSPADGVYPIYATQRPIDTNCIAGTYTTDFGIMTLNVQGSKVTGVYDFRKGRISGELNGNRLTGTWTQDNGTGKINFVFRSGCSGFDGLWAYGTDQPDRLWKGSRSPAN